MGIRGRRETRGTRKQGSRGAEGLKVQLPTTNYQFPTPFLHAPRTTLY
ncbi:MULTISPECIES: hypothetical protein [Chroococcidiopsis]|nr:MULTISPECIES: hypothetical protein [Chroococcidiopsis]URD49644.1 hypothetical protein M5J74_25400 [Chroococcidiopsis sp. CCNUC1]